MLSLCCVISDLWASGTWGPEKSRNKEKVSNTGKMHVPQPYGCNNSRSGSGGDCNDNW